MNKEEKNKGRVKVGDRYIVDRDRNVENKLLELKRQYKKNHLLIDWKNEQINRNNDEYFHAYNYSLIFNLIDFAADGYFMHHTAIVIAVTATTGSPRLHLYALMHSSAPQTSLTLNADDSKYFVVVIFVHLFNR